MITPQISDQMNGDCTFVCSIIAFNDFVDILQTFNRPVPSICPVTRARYSGMDLLASFQDAGSPASLRKHVVSRSNGINEATIRLLNEG